MAKEVFMPKAGMDMQEGYINKWLVEVGDSVKEGDALLEIETDKVTMEVEAPASGTLLCKYFEDGATVPVVTIIGYIGEKGEQVPAAPQMAGTDASAKKESPAPETAAAYDYDVAVIGGGPAGYVGAIRAAQLGGKVVLFEKDIVGGTCLNRGCIPTKTYLKSAEYLHHIHSAAARGIHVDTTSVRVDMPTVYAHKEGVVKKLTDGVAALLKSRNVEVVHGEATLTGRHEVACKDTRYSARSILLCGGSKAGRIPVPGVENTRVLTSDELLALQEVPRRLAVVGGGVIGCELATAFQAFGSEVVVIEALDRLVPMMDAEISKFLGKTMKKAGIQLKLGKQVEKIEQTESEALVYIAGEEPVRADVVLLSVGREAVVDCLGVLKDEITTVRGKVVVDDTCATNIEHIYACGDITNRSTLAHAAFHMGECAAENAMGKQETVALSRVPSCLYTLPEAAGVGLTEEEARAEYKEILVGRFPYIANGRALASGEPEGFVKVLADAQYGEILGVHILGGVATELIGEAKALMDSEITIHEAANIMHAHPTYAEALYEAFNDALGRCVHLPAKRR